MEHHGLKMGLIGAGWWATTLHLPELTADGRVTLSAVSRLGRAELGRVQRTFGARAGYEDYRKMLREEQLDAVVIASPHTLHFEHARAALECGCHVLVEKPMTTNASEARQLVALAERKKAILMVAYGYNFTPIVEQAVSLIAAGAVGEVRHVVLHMASSLEDLFSGQGLHAAKHAMFQPLASTWSDPKNAGGYGWGQLTHALGVLFRLVDLEPVEVFATTQRSASGADLTDAACLTLQGGATASLSGTALIPKHQRAQLDVRLFGSQGSLLMDFDRERLEAQRYDERGTTVSLEPGAGDYLPAAPIRAFIDICAGERRVNQAPGVVGVRSTQVLEALYRSAASRRPEKCSWQDPLP